MSISADGHLLQFNILLISEVWFIILMGILIIVTSAFPTQYSRFDVDQYLFQLEPGPLLALRNEYVSNANGSVAIFLKPRIKSLRLPWTKAVRMDPKHTE